MNSCLDSEASRSSGRPPLRPTPGFTVALLGSRGGRAGGGSTYNASMQREGGTVAESKADQSERIKAPHGRCPHCGAPNQPFTKECRHRRACEARQMLQAGVPVEKAAAHAQRRTL